MRGNLKFRVRQLATALLASAALVAVAGLAGAAWDGTQEINLGDKVSAEFAVADTHHHEFSFWAPKDTVLNVKAKVASGLVLEYALHNQLDADQPLGDTASAKGIKNYKILADSYYTLHVSADAGAGVYELTTSAKFPTKIAKAVTADTPFGAMKGALCSASVKPSKTGPGAATITSVKMPGGTVAGVSAGIASFKNLALPKSTTYTLDLTFTKAGNVDISIGLKTKIAKRTWSFGIVDVAEGTATGIRADWLSSPHNDSASEAFRHWDSAGAFTGTDVACAKCHASGGYQDWVGADGTAFEALDATSFPLGTTVDCDACHSAATATLDTVLFPSGERIDGLGPEARCMQCHQGRESTVSMNTAIATYGGADPDAVPDTKTRASDGTVTDVADLKSDLSFLNVHYLAAGATLYGRQAMGGYQYDGLAYNGRYYHVKEKDSCVECHDQHTTKLKISECAECHPGVATVDDLKNVRMIRTTYDYDDDGDTTEGVAGEIDGMAAALFAAMREYSRHITFGDVTGFPIGWSAAYPYYFEDTNDNGAKDTGEGSYTHWTTRLLQAAYNYQYWKKDPGAYAHNARYTMELLCDSYDDLNGALGANALATVLVRNEAGGHFDASSMVYRDWDDTGTASASCARCHTPDGFEFYASYTTKSAEFDVPYRVPLPEGMRCESCHPDNADFAGTPALRPVAAVWFPSDLVVENTAADPSFTCLTCHQGRESKKTVDAYILLNADPTKWSYRNPHYLPAGGTLFGTGAQVAYEYAGKTYKGKWAHAGSTTNQCTYCHMQDGSHEFKPEAGTSCQVCHGAIPLENFRLKTIGVNDTVDYDGDGNTTETLKDELDGLVARLITSIQDYCQTNGRAIPVFNPVGGRVYKDANANRTYDTGVDTSSYTGASTWDASLLKTAFNVTYYYREPATWAHNREYMVQILYDGIVEMGGSTTGLTRP